MHQTIHPVSSLQGTLAVPGDKSISHRAVMLGALAEGKTEIRGFLYGEDCLSTLKAFQALGVAIEMTEEAITITGRGLDGLSEPENVIDVGNSGTTMRLLSGILAGQTFTTFLTGDASIRKRPMGRVITPLTQMGAKIIGRKQNTLAPLAITGSPLKAITYRTPVASAQVKSAILLAALYAPGWTTVFEPAPSRDHTELMLRAFGAEVETLPGGIRIKGRPQLYGQKLTIPGDISSAAYALVAGAIVPNSRIIVQNVGLNPTRTGILTILQQMGAQVTILEEWRSGGEPVGNILVESSVLKGITIKGDIIPTLIDEIPVIAVAAAYAQGVTEIHDAQELKVKESNRLETIAQGLRAFGCQIDVLEDGLRIEGGHSLHGAHCQSYGDHRIAMAMAVAAMAAKGESIIDDFEAVSVSWPHFLHGFQQLAGEKHA